MTRTETVAERMLARGVAKVERMPWENHGGRNGWTYCYDVVCGCVVHGSFFNAGHAEALATVINTNRAAQMRPVPYLETMKGERGDYAF